MNQFKLILILAFAFLLVLVAVVNQPQVSLNLLFWKTPELSLVVFVFASILLGGIFTAVFGAISQVKLKRSLAAKEKKIKELEELVAKLQLAVGGGSTPTQKKISFNDIEPQE